jgi:hypothetical protein
MMELAITSLKLIVDSEVHLSTPTTANADDWFPQLFKNGTIKRKRKSTRKGEGRVRGRLYNKHFHGAWATPFLS